VSIADETAPTDLPTKDRLLAILKFYWEADFEAELVQRRTADGPAHEDSFERQCWWRDAIDTISNTFVTALVGQWTLAEAEADLRVWFGSSTRSQIVVADVLRRLQGYDGPRPELPPKEPQ
jgi:hypothetical protein